MTTPIDYLNPQLPPGLKCVTMPTGASVGAVVVAAASAEAGR